MSDAVVNSLMGLMALALGKVWLQQQRNMRVYRASRRRWRAMCRTMFEWMKDRERDLEGQDSLLDATAECPMVECPLRERTSKRTRHKPLPENFKEWLAEAEEAEDEDEDGDEEPVKVDRKRRPWYKL